MNRCRPFGCLHRGTKRLTQALHNTVASACVRDDTVEVQDSGPMLFATGGAVAFPAAYTTASTAPRSMPSGLMQAQESHLVCAFYCVHVSAGIVHARLYVFRRGLRVRPRRRSNASYVVHEAPKRGFTEDRLLWGLPMSTDQYKSRENIC